ncbi:MAG TPA: hypothetical protein VF132_14750 [Rudaea sp.]
MARFSGKRVLLAGLLAALAANFAIGEEASDGTAVVHSTISAHAPKDCGGGFWSVHYDDAYRTLREAEEYKPGARTYYVRELSDRRNEYLLAGISPSFRKDWLSSHQTPEKEAHCIVPLFDEIGAAAKRTLPNFRPTSYKFHEASDEALIKEAIKDKMPEAVILETGVQQASWDIEKLNNGIPKDRYKYGMAWVKSPKFDDGYCRIVHVNIIQDYAGGGTYAESKSRYINMIPAGCK